MADYYSQPGPADGNSARLAPPRPAQTRSPQLPTLLVLLVLVASVWLGPRLAENLQYSLTRGRERAEVEIAREELKNGQLPEFVHAFEEVAKSIGPSVVHIDTIKAIQPRRDQMSYMFGRNGQQGYAEEQGSGVIVDHEGYILTNFHVVDGAGQLTVSLSDGREIPATEMGTDPSTDLAVLKIDAEGLTPANWGDSDALPVGAPVWGRGQSLRLGPQRDLWNYQRQKPTRIER